MKNYSESKNKFTQDILSYIFIFFVIIGFFTFFLVMVSPHTSNILLGLFIGDIYILTFLGFYLTVKNEKTQIDR